MNAHSNHPHPPVIFLVLKDPCTDYFLDQNFPCLTGHGENVTTHPLSDFLFLSSDKEREESHPTDHHQDFMRKFVEFY